MRQTGEGLTARHGKSVNFAKVLPMEFDDSQEKEQSIDNLIPVKSEDLILNTPIATVNSKEP